MWIKGHQRKEIEEKNILNLEPKEMLAIERRQAKQRSGLKGGREHSRGFCELVQMWQKYARQKTSTARIKTFPLTVSKRQIVVNAPTEGAIK